MVVMWLVSSNFRAANAAATARESGFFATLVAYIRSSAAGVNGANNGDYLGDEGIETEALLVLQVRARKHVNKYKNFCAPRVVCISRGVPNFYRANLYSGIFIAANFHSSAFS